MEKSRRSILGTLSCLATSGCLGLDFPMRSSKRSETTPVATKKTTTQPHPNVISDPYNVLGATHVDGLYHFTGEDFLNEGAETIGELGLGVIRTWATNMESSYRFNSNWPTFEGLVEILSHSYYQSLFEKEFHTHHLTAYSQFDEIFYWRDGISNKQYRKEVDEFRDATEHLLTEYDGTGKTFVFGIWEGDWTVLPDNNTEIEIPRDRAKNMIRWLDARQKGIEEARQSIESDVVVLNSASVNRVQDAMENDYPRVINKIIPKTCVDLVAYSAYDMMEQYEASDRSLQRDVDLTKEYLDYIHERAPEPSAYVQEAIPEGQKNVFIGEFGAPLVRAWGDRGMRRIRAVTRGALEWGAPWAIYWQVYDNEPQNLDHRPTNDEVAGFYLIKPDGTRAPTWWYFRSVLGMGLEDLPFTPLPPEWLDRSTWSATASHYSEKYDTPPSNVLDGSKNSHWASGTSIHSTDLSITIDMNESKTFNRIRIEHPFHAAYPSQFEIEISTDDRNWKSVRMSYSSDMVDIRFDETLRAQYLRLSENDKSTENWWKVGEIYVYD